VTHALTPREQEVLVLMAEGYTNKEIGKQIHAAEETIKSHTKSIYYKLDARNRAHAVALGIGKASR
jgi:DNA-binding CsgD family transcriptional regulator